MLPSNNKESTIVKCDNVAESQMHNAKYRNLDSKGFTMWVHL